ncbi:hypothetical protein GCM10010172_79650 [Paractinoplanes ferrugineus]|uniref:Uncharacterized protein n=1 Tax=Paractinoplanes ferrugineus TaxID=113564 RepID=A0A919MFR3_9ACTN|nr:hypothetical protein [Actinoplanes ferrugineus]GIE13039.1 hypothetical protein Afe05nite_48790 [Actinoplanes ferrugineus]
MDRAFEAYAVGRADGLAAHRDAQRATDPECGRDYRIGFLDGRLEIFRMLASVRKIVEDD